MDIGLYTLHPPKEIFEKFEAAKNTNLIYNSALNKIRESITAKFRQELELAKKTMPRNPSNIHIRKFESAVKHLPETLKNALEIELEYCKKDIMSMDQVTNSTFTDVISDGDPKSIKVLLEQYKTSPGMQSFIKKGREIVLNQMQDVVNKINHYFEQTDVKEALSVVKILYEYKIELETIVTDVREPYLKARSNIKKKFQLAYICFMNHFLQNNTSEMTNEIIRNVEKSFLCLFEFINFAHDLKGQPILTHMFPEDFNEKIIILSRKTADYFMQIQKNYESALEIIDIASLKDILDMMNKWDSLPMTMKNIIQIYHIEDISVNSMTMAISKLTVYSHMLESVSKKIEELKNQLIHQKLINPETIQFNQHRDKFYRNLNEKIRILNNVQLLSKHDLNININLGKSECLKSLVTQITDISIATEVFLKKFSEDSRLIGEDYDNFNSYYNNLLSCQRELTEIDCEINKHVEKIEKIIFDKIHIWAGVVDQDSSVQHVSTCLINMKRVSNNISSLKVRIHQIIDEALINYKNKTKDSTNFSKLSAIVNQDASGIGQSFIAEHKAFQGYSLSLFNEKTQRHDIDYILKNITGDFINKDLLRKRHKEFQDIYGDLIRKYLKDNVERENLIVETKLVAGDIKQTPEKIAWDASVRDKVPRLLAHVFALWTLQNASNYFEVATEENQSSYLLRPHAAQVVSIFRMLGIGDKKEELTNNLVQIGTGEGKSVTLGATATILALLGFDVRCACYSEYLSQRDYKGFLPVFESLGVVQYIRYGTFNKLCENMINRNGNIRQMVEEFILNGSSSAAQSSQRIERAKILLIDEVDIFFSRDFYGNVYTPSASLRDPTITSLISYIWTQRKSNLNLNQIKATAQYQACCNRFPTWEPLILEAVKDIIYDVQSFESHDYFVNQDKIGYVEQDNIAYNVVYGYKTLFAYYCEHENGKITSQILDERISIKIRCGNFSYAEIPLQFKYIMGVTGTLETLSDPEKEVIKTVYKIGKNTYTPSVFGKNNLKFREKDDISIENIDNYFNTIIREIDDRLVGGKSSEKRAVLVIFESISKLKEFYESKALEAIKPSVAYLIEEASSEEKEVTIKRATTSGQITLLTRPFGRRTDFVCYDPSVVNNDGTHIIQTFLSEESSEEKQIKGRTARQGNYGSYSI
ncbi:unnamed protein product [Rotaria sp. Silwood2]|nr:unnamed protein product [Rotaria sp. Silwood2]